MQREIKITYSWWRTDGKDKEIKYNHTQALEESAMERILYSMNEEVHSGELNDNIIMDEEDGDDGISYRGWFETKTKTI